jgi:hypothetical protein
MSIWIEVHHCSTDRKVAKAEEKKFDKAVDKILKGFGKPRFGGTEDFKEILGLTKDQQKVLVEKVEALAKEVNMNLGGLGHRIIDYGMVPLATHPSVSSVPGPSKLYPKNEFNGLGHFHTNIHNEIIGDRSGTSLTYILGRRGASSEFHPNWKTALVRADQAIEKQRKKDKEHWYMHLLEIVRETIQFVLSQPNPKQFFVQWSE